MSFRINTNVAALNAHTIGVRNNRDLASSLEKLSSGLRINKAADDASGMAIADSLRSQSASLGQAIRNANDAIGIVQTADKAMDEQIKILDTVKTKAVQAAQDGQTTETRKALQSDILRLLEELDNIANTTSFNGQQLLAGSFSNKEFQIGAYSNTTIKASIGPTGSDKIGHVRFETSAMDRDGMEVSAGAHNLQEVTLNFKQANGVNDFKLESVKISTSAGTGLGALVEVINKNSNTLGVRATATVIGTGGEPVQSGTIRGLTINGVLIGNINDVKRNDRDGRLVNAINSVKERTGVEAYTDITGRINLKSMDGRAIAVHAVSASAHVFGGGNFVGISGNAHAIVGRLTLIKQDARDIAISGINYSHIGLHSAQGIAEYTVNLRAVRGVFDANVASASGGNANAAQAKLNFKGIGAGVTSLRGAMVVMDMAESARTQLDKIRSDLGSVQMELVTTINNISVTQVNVKAAESQIRDVDFAEESASFSKYNILAQSGSFAMAQANAVQQNVLRLLQ
ncbi:Flagellin [Helicobacter heilmannii]|uniref:flagellin B n=1 Tax=Helicobacter heilmannii TaxID=35817 RepID=UPI0006A060FF|nr:flagellin B [Helicobacter heilmannii]GMB93932.1 Flagellin B FlaB [Helicobacter heilmannii]CRF47527.1 Flagellin [Helicobacter heilmannii]